MLGKRITKVFEGVRGYDQVFPEMWGEKRGSPQLKLGRGGETWGEM